MRQSPSGREAGFGHDRAIPSVTLMSSPTSLPTVLGADFDGGRGGVTPGPRGPCRWARGSGLGQRTSISSLPRWSRGSPLLGLRRVLMALPPTGRSRDGCGNRIGRGRSRAGRSRWRTCCPVSAHIRFRLPRSQSIVQPRLRSTGAARTMGRSRPCAAGRCGGSTAGHAGPGWRYRTGLRAPTVRRSPRRGEVLLRHAGGIGDAAGFHRQHPVRQVGGQ